MINGWWRMVSLFNQMLEDLKLKIYIHEKPLFFCCKNSEKDFFVYLFELLLWLTIFFFNLFIYRTVWEEKKFIHENFIQSIV